MSEEEGEKGDLSYRYWDRKSDDKAAAPELYGERKALTEEDTKALPKTSSGSAWNHAGTFEEVSQTEWAKGRLGELICGLSPKCAEGGVVKITEIKSCTGDATCVIARGKKRAGFDFELVLKWSASFGTGADDDLAVEGTCKIHEASNDNMNEVEVGEVEVTSGKKQDHGKREAAAAAAVRKNLGPLMEPKLEKLLAELKDRI